MHRRLMPGAFQRPCQVHAHLWQDVDVAHKPTRRSGIGNKKPMHRRLMPGPLQRPCQVHAHLWRDVGVAHKPTRKSGIGNGDTGWPTLAKSWPTLAKSWPNQHRAGLISTELADTSNGWPTPATAGLHQQRTDQHRQRPDRCDQGSPHLPSSAEDTKKEHRKHLVPLKTSFQGPELATFRPPG